MGKLNDDQFGLFSENHPAMRQRGLAEFSPDEFREKPGAWHHGTFKSSMPTDSTSGESAGIHLGTLKAAQERLEQSGKRDHSMTPARPGLRSPDAGEIHTRRLDESVGARGKSMLGSEDNPRPDMGMSWDEEENDHGEYEDRGAHAFGEYYENDQEDAGSVSIRVPDDSYLTNHRNAIDKAVRAGKPVHPLVRGLIDNHGGQGIDEPQQSDSQKKDSFWFTRTDMITPHGAHKSDPGQPMLLPYKVESTEMESIPNENRHLQGGTGQERHYRKAVTFASSKEEIATHNNSGDESQSRWSDRFYEGR